jgi:predicted metal-dependent enzyme (double-stranded beta helix superfamily)
MPDSAELTPVAAELIRGIDESVRLGDVDAIVESVKGHLVRAAERNGELLPRSFYSPRDDCYARRLLHRSPDGGYTVVVMTWGPGQGTPLHDHAGMWCVECVVKGELHVTQFDLSEQGGDRYRFERQEKIHAVVGDAGCLIPPHEYHVLTNALPDEVTLTVHVYGGEMERCHAFLPEEDGWWRQESRPLRYDNA